MAVQKDRPGREGRGRLSWRVSPHCCEHHISHHTFLNLWVKHVDLDTAALRTGTTATVEAEKPPESVPQCEPIKSSINVRKQKLVKAFTFTVI